MSKKNEFLEKFKLYNEGFDKDNDNVSIYFHGCGGEFGGFSRIEIGKFDGKESKTIEGNWDFIRFNS